MGFVMRTNKPGKGNKYYITKGNGGYSNAIKGKPTDSACDVLSNCVGYAYGRFNEIGGYGYCKYLAPVNAERFIQFKGTCKVGQTPKVGACMVWQKGATLDGSDGAGHVAIVEKVINSTTVYTSESGYGGSAFWNSTRKKGSGNWGCGSGYKFLGFIYNPAVKDEPIKSEPVKTTTSATSTSIKAGDVVKLASNAMYYNGQDVPDWVVKTNWIVSEISGNRAVIDKSADKKSSICSPIHTKYLTKVTTSSFKSYTVKVTTSALRIRSGAGLTYSEVGMIRDFGKYVIVDEKNGWGKLQNGKGWICLDYTCKV